MLNIHGKTGWEKDELMILKALDVAVRSEATRVKIDEIVARVEQDLAGTSDNVLAWEPIPLACYSSPLPKAIRSSWLFILRACTTTGAERHPNSYQRMMSYRGSGDFQTRLEGAWKSHHLTSDQSVPIKERWISIPPAVWHQGVVPAENWVVVSFHTVPNGELIEERLESEGSDATRQRKYVG